jgi:hypothetical protein
MNGADGESSMSKPTRTDSIRVNTTAVLEPHVASAPMSAQAPAGPAPGDRRVAVVVCHGMGQQVQFETLECLAESLRRAAGDPERRVRTEVVRLEQMSARPDKPAEPVDLRRAEIDLPGAGGDQRVHLYEAYWAPITEGQVSLREVFDFLFTAGRRGIRQWAGSGVFDRWMFGDWVNFTVPLRTPLKLLGIVLMLLALAAINAILVGVVAARLGGAAIQWPKRDLFLAFTSDIAVATIGLVAIVIGVAVLPRLRRYLGNPLTSVLAWVVIYAGFVAIFVAAVLCVIALAVSQFGRHPDTGWLADFMDHLKGVRSVLFITFVWGMPALAAAAARWFLVQYVGDVVAYVSSHSVSRFAEIRRAIQEVSLKVGSSVYHAVREDGVTPLYTHVIVVGHSLGSVVAYDMLNSLLTQDRLGGDAARVRERTALFLTFGSPLNKTAYIFRTQRARGSDVRETMAAAVQPMISSYDNRTFPWINLYSNHDWIGGRLNFYDRNPPEDHRRVHNCSDPDARTPLKAHNEHWQGKLLSRKLKEAILGEKGAPAGEA